MNMPPRSNAVLVVRGLTVVLGERPVLDGVDLDVAAGERLVLVGRSGCGKSTLLRALAGFQGLDGGSIELDGEVLARDGRQIVAPEKRSIGSLFQGGGLWPHMSVRGTLEFALGACGVPRRERRTRAAELLARVRLVGLDERLPATLSGGEAQRLSLARALVRRPRLLLLDEPLGPLDAELRGELLAELDALQAEFGFAAVHVTHDPIEARGSHTRTVRLNAGRLAPFEAAPQKS